LIELTKIFKDRVRAHEGCVETVYLDSLGKATIGIGHLVQPHEKERYKEGVTLSQQEIDDLFDIDLNRAAKKGVSKFKGMWKALSEKDFVQAAIEMRDSRWKLQTPGRCESLAKIVENA
jgi:GH24 family phage-related lysozyme (muramidase)